MRDVISRVVDGSRFREFKKEYGTTIVTVCIRLLWIAIFSYLGRDLHTSTGSKSV
jgi:hypothetical protein